MVETKEAVYQKVRFAELFETDCIAGA